MKIVNPQKIEKAGLLVGIPSYNEAKNIGSVVEKIEEGLKRYFPEKKSVIVNVDNCSLDGTREAFFKAGSPNFPKIYVTTPKNTKGKGYNFRNFFKLIKKLEGKTGLVVDADLKSITPLWIKKLLQPIFEKNYQFVLPFYARRKNDGAITNHLVYPMVYGFFGLDVRQPIGGEFAFSSQLVDVWLEKKWSKTVYQFGIDIFMSLEAFFAKKRICQVNLGKKIHNPSTPKLNHMFEEVALTLFELLEKRQMPRIDKPKKIPVFFGKKLEKIKESHPKPKEFEKIFLKEFKNYQNFSEKYFDQRISQKLVEMFQKKKVKISSSLWAEIVWSVLLKESLPLKKRIDFLRCIFFGRLASFFEESKNMDLLQTEKLIQSQAKIFFKKRNDFLFKD